MKILIVNSHTIYRDGLVVQMKKIFKGLEMLEAESYEQAFEILDRDKNIFLTFLDMDMAEMEWKEGIDRILQHAPTMKIAMIAGNADIHDVRYAFNKGAVGFIPKAYPIKVLISTIRLIIDGGTFFPMLSVAESAEARRIRETNESAPVQLRNGSLTSRQEEVLVLLGRGYSNKQIAYNMQVSEATVKLHMNSLLRILGVKNRTHAVLVAQQMGLLPKE